MKKIEKYIYVVIALIIGAVLASVVTYVIMDNKINNEQNVNNSGNIVENNENVDNSNNKTNLDKAKRIAKEVEKAVNDENWDYLDKNAAAGSNAFKDYGIYNYVVDIDNYEYIEEYNEYVFRESYDWDRTKIESLKDVSLGKMLIIKFEDNGKIVIDTNCTGY